MTVTGQMPKLCKPPMPPQLCSSTLEWYMSEMSTTLLDSDMTYLFHDLCTTSLTDCHSQRYGHTGIQYRGARERTQ